MFPMKCFVETERLYLRFIEREDVDFLYELNSDPVVMLHLTDGRPDTKQEVKDNVEKILKRREYYRDQYGDFLGVLKKNTEPFGWFCLRPAHEDKDNFESIEIGWRLLQKNWRKGLATEAAQALLQKAFVDYQVPKVFARTMAANRASQKVMQRLGMSFVKNYQELKFPGKNKNGVWYEIERSTTCCERR